MKNALLLHGTGGNPMGNWFPWLKEQLEQKGYKVWCPDLPLAEKPNIARYKQYLFENWKLDKYSIIIGHSSGAVAALGLLQFLPVGLQIKKEILVSAFKDDLGIADLKELFVRPFNFEKIKNHCKRFVLICSDNDPYIPLTHGQLLRDQLNGELVVLDGQKHFSIETMGEAYLKFPQILEYI